MKMQIYQLCAEDIFLNVSIGYPNSYQSAGKPEFPGQSLACCFATNCDKSVKIKLVATCDLQTCYNNLLKQLVASL